MAVALGYSQATNIKLLGIANDFVTETQQIGASRASVLRMVQTGGIVLALLNFAFILFKFLKRLQTSDAAIEAANEENREILTSVREGLFLITPDFRLGSQLSTSAHNLFGRQLAPGDDFFALLHPLVSETALTNARNYVQLLFASHVKEALVQGINPLSEVEVAGRNRLGQDTRRHLSFHFNRVQEDGVVRHLLVTVQDISARIELEAKLQGERQRSQKEFAMLLKAIDADPALLRQFVARAEASLLEINDIMRSTSAAHGEAAILKRLDEIARRLHSLKGDAGTLGLETVANQAHLFENELQRIRQSGGDGGDLGAALLALPLPLEDLLNKVAALKSLTGLQRPAQESDSPVCGQRLTGQAGAGRGRRQWQEGPRRGGDQQPERPARNHWNLGARDRRAVGAQRRGARRGNAAGASCRGQARRRKGRSATGARRNRVDARGTRRRRRPVRHEGAPQAARSGLVHGPTARQLRRPPDRVAHLQARFLHRRQPVDARRPGRRPGPGAVERAETRRPDPAELHAGRVHRVQDQVQRMTERRPAMRMLIVDDSNMIRSRISRVVQSGGLAGVSLVGLARNGAEAVRIARATQPEVVTMDLTMPEMDGVECIGQLLRLFPKINILVVSALSDKSTAIAALTLGARGFVAKPFTDDELKMALLEVAETR